jgi:hypothetical protein
VFQNCIQEIGIRQLKKQHHEQAMESFALNNQSKINLLLESDLNPNSFELHWNLLGFSESFIPVLLKNKFTSKALETLILLGDTNQSMKIIQSKKDYVKRFQKELEQISDLCIENQSTDLFLQIQTLLGIKEKEINYFLKHDMADQLSLFIRKNDFGAKDKKILHMVLDYFERKKNVRASWEVLLKLKDKKLMIKYAIQNKNFSDALKLLKESKQYLTCAELTLPLAQYLVYKHKFKEAFDLHKKVGKGYEFENVMKSYVKLQFLQENFTQLTNAFRFLYKIRRNSFYFKFLTFFEIYSSLHLEIQKIKAVGSNLSDQKWRQSFKTYLSNEKFQVNERSYSRKCVLESKIKHLLQQTSIIENQTFLKLKQKLNKYSSFVQSLGDVTHFSKSGMTTDIDKENVHHNLGSKRRFKKFLRKNKTQNDFTCFLCNSSNSSTNKGSMSCSDCNLQYSFCPLSGLLIPVLQFSLQSGEGI